ncbi:MAG: hypothetical protein K0R36_3373 [Chryseobacterium sp.]|jgi:hypothetical protein|nr:hypothetical protein [Chryseobacterium sp.]
MLKIEDTIPINKYGQGLTDMFQIVDLFKVFDNEKKRYYLEEIVALIMQSRPTSEDIEPAIKESQLRPTLTPCVLLRKGVETYKLKKIINLPENELEKSLKLLLALFKMAYQRRFNDEKNNSGKWWYWDLSDETNINKIKQDI